MIGYNIFRLFTTTKTVSLSCLTLTLKTLLLSLNTFDLRSLSTGFALVGLAPLGFG